MTNHMWDGFWILANSKIWEKRPSDPKRSSSSTKHFNASAVLAERADMRRR